MPKSNVSSKSKNDSKDDLEFESSREFDGDDDQPIDADTGESLFEDLTPRLRTLRADPKEKAEDEELEVEPGEDEEPDEEPADEKDERTVEDESEDEEPEEQARDEKPNGSWSRRLQREKRLREEAEANFQDLQARTAAIEAKMETESNEAEFTRTKSDLQGKITTLEEQLDAAIEEGKTKDQIALQKKLTTLMVELRVKEDKYETAKAAVAQKKQSGENTIVARKASQWKRKHQSFERDPVFTAAAKAIDKQIANEGFNPETDAYYVELDRRLKGRFPEEYKGQRAVPRKDDVKEGDEGRRSAKHPNQSFRREGGIKPKMHKGFEIRGKKVKLTPRQQTNMRNFGLDPNDAKDVNEYVRNNI